MAHVHCMVGNQGYKHTNSGCVKHVAFALLQRLDAASQCYVTCTLPVLLHTVHDICLRCCSVCVIQLHLSALLQCLCDSATFVCAAAVSVWFIYCCLRCCSVCVIQLHLSALLQCLCDSAKFVCAAAVSVWFSYICRCLQCETHLGSSCELHQIPLVGF
jgi:hypothetical protein